MVLSQEASTTAAVQKYLGDLAVLEDAAATQVVQALLTRSVRRLHTLCSIVLHRNYPRLTRAPFHLETEELLSAVVERLMKALQRSRPKSVRHFFALATQHMRWELNDLARRLDKKPELQLEETNIPAPQRSSSELSQTTRKILDAIEKLPDSERETFSLVRIQGVTHEEAAQIIGVSLKTIQRRLNRSLMLLTQSLTEFQNSEE